MTYLGRRLHAMLVFLAVTAIAAMSVASGSELLPGETPIHAAVDHYIQDKLSSDNVQPAPLAADTNFVRRLTLDLAGRIPTSAEARAYVDSTETDKRLQLMDRLLAAPDFAYHHRNELDAMLLATKKSDVAWRAYLLQAAEQNRPWDQLFREMLLGSEEDAAQKPALEFLKARARDVDDMTNETSALFFGVSINCAKCHDHPLVSDWKQDHYFGFASFFSRTYLTKKNTLAEKYSGALKFKTTAGEEKQAGFMFLTGAVVEEPVVEKTKEQLKTEDEEVQRQMKDDKAPPPKPPEFSPRTKFVELALDPANRHFFSRSIVNRIWARLMGRGLVDPLDQMHSANPASHPELLDWLARDLVENQYDLKRLIRGIVASQTYARSSRWEGGDGPPSAEYFALAQPRVLSPRQYALSVVIATSNPTNFADATKPDEWKKQQESFENASNALAGQLELPTEHFQVSVDEALLFSNNERIQNEYLRDSRDRLVGHLKEVSDRPALIETAFWAVLSRAPDAEEFRLFDEYLNERQDRPEAGIQQIVWALLTSPELRFNY